MHNGKKLKHIYHIYADGHWEAPFTEHIKALEETGLMEALDFIGVGIVGCEENREAVKKCLPPKFEVLVEACSGFEQVTMEFIDASEPAFIFYAHTKGAANPHHLRKIWRESMTNGTVYGWKTCVDLLSQGYDAVGLYWQEAPHYHFSGTFWWATSDYIQTLPPITYVTRFDAEMWIGKGSRGGKFGDFCPGFVSHSNVLKRKPDSTTPDPFPGMMTIMPVSKIAGYQKGKIYTVPANEFMHNAITRGHFQLLDRNHDPVKTIVIKR